MRSRQGQTLGVPRSSSSSRPSNSTPAMTYSEAQTTSAAAAGAPAGDHLQQTATGHPHARPYVRSRALMSATLLAHLTSAG